MSHSPTMQPYICQYRMTSPRNVQCADITWPQQGMLNVLRSHDLTKECWMCQYHRTSPRNVEYAEITWHHRRMLNVLISHDLTWVLMSHDFTQWWTIFYVHASILTLYKRHDRTQNKHTTCYYVIMKSQTKIGKTMGSLLHMIYECDPQTMPIPTTIYNVYKCLHSRRL